MRTSLARIVKNIAASGQGETLLGDVVKAFSSSARRVRFSTESKELMDAEIEHATGLERQQLEAEKRGEDLFREAWLDSPFGTEENPVEVTSEFSERVIGVPDAEDDSTIWWGTLKAGDPPTQITENGEFFVLKQLPKSTSSH